MLDVFLVSVIYWLSLLVIFLWLNRRLVSLTETIGIGREVRGPEKGV